MQPASVFLLPNGTFFVELIVFLIIVFVIGKYILPPLNRAMEQRQQQIQSSLDAADEARADAAAADDERRAVLEAARHQAREIVAQANRTAEQVSVDAQARGQSEYDRLLAAAETEVRLARQRALEEAAARLGELVVDVVERVIGREVDVQAHRDLIEEAVGALSDDGAADAAAAGAGVETVNPQLEGYAAAVLGAGPPADDTAAGADRASLAADLAAVDRLFVANAALRTALTDTSVAPPARRAVLDDLLDGRVSDGARRAAAYAAAAVPAPDVPAAITWLAHRAHRAVEGQEEVEPALGHLAARARVGGFAAALFEDLPVDRLEEVEDELFRFARTVETTPALRAALTDRDLPAPVRRGVVDDLLAGKVQPATLRLVDYTVTGGRPRDVLGTLFWLVDQTARARGWRVAVVDAAREVDDDERRLLSDSLGRVAGQPVELQVKIDPALLAGVRVRIGDLQVEATARSRLDQLREHVVSGGWEDRGFGAAGRGGTR